MSGKALPINEDESTEFLQVAELFFLCEDVFFAEWVFEHLISSPGRWGEWIFRRKAFFEYLFLLSAEGWLREATPHIPPLSPFLWFASQGRTVGWSGAR